MENVKVTLEQIEKYGERLTPIKELAYLIDVPEMELQEEINNLHSPMRKAYMRGRARTADSLREQLLSNAMAGSPTSIVELLQQLNALNG